MSAETVTIDALRALRGRLVDARLTLDAPGADRARHDRQELLGQIDDYLLPRLTTIDAPLLLVVGGSTGAGKSTIVNSLVGGIVSPSGVLRPTTRSPVLLCHPDDTQWFGDRRVLPSLARVTGGPDAATSTSVLRIAPTSTVPVGLALLDAPDVDSVVAENRELAAQLLAAADLWLFVTTAARYADAVPWDYLRNARERSTALAVVLNRVPPGADAEIRAHLSSMLDREGLSGTALFTVSEGPLDAQLLPTAASAPIREWLDELAADADARAAVVRRTLDGALASLVPRVALVADAVEAQRRAGADLVATVDRAYADATSELEDAVTTGAALRGEVLDRWQEFVGTGELMRSVQQGLGRWRDRLKAALTGRPQPATELRASLEQSIQAMIVAAADHAADRVVESWSATTAGRHLVADARGLDRATPGLPAAATAEIHAWQGDVLQLVSAEGADKRATARAVSLGINGAGLVAMIAVFAQTGGITGTEAAVAGGTATASQAALSAVFGEQAVRSLTNDARNNLLGRIERLLRGERQRFDERLATVVPTASEAAGLRTAAQFGRRPR